MSTQALWLVRHGESMANIAAEEAEASGQDAVAVGHRDADVPLSPLGERQAAAFGLWLREKKLRARLSTAWTSPYLRATQTTQIASVQAKLSNPVLVDERLRDRELGVLDTLTRKGVENRLPTPITTC